MKVLFVHDYDFRTVNGGAELNQRYIYNNPPDGVEVDFLESANFLRRKVRGYDKMVIGNVRRLAPNMVERMVDIMLDLRIPYIKSEHDIMWSDDRMCKELNIWSPFDIEIKDLNYVNNIWYRPTRKLFGSAEKVRFLSPKHHKLFTTVGINPHDVFIAGSYVDKSIFRNMVEWDYRPYDAFVKEGNKWGQSVALKMAQDDGIKDVHTYKHKGRTVLQMADWYNQYKYFYDYPLMPTTYGRAVIEAYLCGVELKLIENHAMLSFKNMDEAVKDSQNAITNFWKGVLG